MLLPRTVFMGSPEFALPILHKLASAYPLVGVFTQPDRPSGRGRKLAPPPVKEAAQSLGLPVYQPERLNRPEAFAELVELAPELIVVAAYGQILRQKVLDLPRYGCINVHGSLLPRWRGAAPVQAALLHGDLETGATIMKMDAGIDTGAILSQASLAIQPEDTSASLLMRIAACGADLLLRTLPPYLAGDLHPQPQDPEKATYAAMLTKEDGALHPEMTVQEWLNRIRAFNPWPGAFITWEDAPLKVFQATAMDLPAGKPGDLAVHKRLPVIRLKDGWLVLQQIQPAGRKTMDGQAFLAGTRRWSGTLHAS